MASDGEPPVPVELRQRTLPGALRYLAGKLREGTDPGAVAFALDALAAPDGPVVGYRIGDQVYAPGDVAVIRAVMPP